MFLMKPDSEKVIQCCLIGDGLVGKSCLARSFLHMTQQTRYTATIFDTYTGKLNVFNKTHTVGIYDTSGQQDHDRLRVFSYRHSDVIVICFSMVDRESFQNVVEFWMAEVKCYERLKTPMILLGTQSDCTNNVEDADNIVKIEEGHKLAETIGACRFLTCSALDAESISRVFGCVVNACIKTRNEKLNMIKKFLKRLTKYIAIKRSMLPD